MKLILCAIFFLLVSCSTEKAEQELDPIEKEYLEKQKTFSAVYCYVYGTSVKRTDRYEAGSSKKILRESQNDTQRLFVVADSSAYRHAFNLSFPLEKDASSFRNWFNLLVDCFNRDSLYLGSIAVNNRCQSFNSNGPMDKRMLEELKSVFPKWYASYEKKCKLY